MFYEAVRWASIPVFAVYFRLGAEGRAAVPLDGPLIVAANHVSYLDPAVLGSACPRKLHFLMDARIHRRAGLGWFFRGMDAIPVEREGSGRDALRRALARLEAGHAVGIFPEGGRVGPGRELEPLAGVALLARRSGAPVLPVGISGTERSLPLGGAFPRPVRVRVRFGRPRLHVVNGEARGGRAADEAFTTDIMARITALAAGSGGGA